MRERLQQLDAGEEFEEGSLLDQLLRSQLRFTKFCDENNLEQMGLGFQKLFSLMIAD